MKKRWIIWISIAAFVWVVLSHLAEIQEVAEPLGKGDWQWIVVAAFLQIAYYIIFSAVFKAAFHTVEVKSRVLELLPVTLGTLFVNTLAPTWGMAGAALFVDDVAHRGQSAARAAAGTLLAQAADYITFSLVLVFGLAYLLLNHDLKAYELVGAVFLLLVISGLGGGLVLAVWRPDWLTRLFGLAQRGINELMIKLKRRTRLTGDWAGQNAAEFIEAANAIKARPWRLFKTLSIALGAHLTNIISLYAIFLAFHQQIGVWALVAGYAIGILFWDISPVPQGIGIVEGVMALLFTTLGVPALTATVIALAFRALDFWLPMVLGFILLRRVKIFGTVKRP